MAALQIVLIVSGNLSFLNWLTLVPILACFDDGAVAPPVAAPLVARAERARGGGDPVARAGRGHRGRGRRGRAAQHRAVVVNMLSGRQMMNTSFTRLPLVNTYGAFGSVGRERDQLVFEGTMDEEITPATTWRAYEWKCQPGDPARRPCWMSPYHYRLDWLLWFAAMGGARRRPVVGAPGLEAARRRSNDARPARDRSVRRHAAAPHPRRSLSLSLRAAGGAAVWWTRERVATWLPPVSRDNEELQIYLRRHGWLRDR